MMHMTTAAEQLRGPRKNQNDSYYVGETWMAVADGVGAEPGSRDAADAAVDYFGTVAKSATGSIARAILDAPARLTSSLVDNGMFGASTIAAAVLDPDGVLWLVSIGDSRFVVIREGVVISTNHLHNRAEYSRLVDPEADVPWGASSSLTRAVTSRGSGVPEIQLVAPLSGDTIVLLTDGVDGKLSLSQLLESVGAHSTPSAMCGAILEHAALYELADNATCAVAVISEGSGRA